MIINANALHIPLADKSVHMICTSPPYWGLRNYGVNGQLGLERTPEEYIANMVAVFRECWRVLRDDGIMFVNIGDSYYGSNQGRMSDGSQVGSKKQMTNRGSVTISGGQRVKPYDTFDKELEDYQDRDCLCGNLCDVCRMVYLNHISRNDDLLGSMLFASLSESIHAYMELLSDHLPTSDLVRQASRILPAIQDRGRLQFLSDAQPRVAQVSTIDEFFQLLLGVCWQRGNSSLCLLCARTLERDVQVFGRNGRACTCGKTSISSSWGFRITDTNHNVDPYLDCTTAYHLKPKDLVGIPWRLAFALQADGWYLRSDIIWSKPNPMPESVTDRPTKSHEYLFLLAKQERYFYDAEAIREPYTEPLNRWGGETLKNDTSKTAAYKEMQKIGNSSAMRVGHPIRPDGSGRNKRSVWTIPTKSYSGAHFATFPPALVEPCIKAGTSERGACPKCGKGWRRVIEKGNLIGKDRGGNYKGREIDLGVKKNGGTPGLAYENIMLGWQPSCTCDAGEHEYNEGLMCNKCQRAKWVIEADNLPCQLPPIPCLVFDPFVGSGTTVKVAYDLGRRGVGLDLSLDYLDEQARKRIHNGHTARLF